MIVGSKPMMKYKAAYMTMSSLYSGLDTNISSQWQWAIRCEIARIYGHHTCRTDIADLGCFRQNLNRIIWWIPVEAEEIRQNCFKWMVSWWRDILPQVNQAMQLTNGNRTSTTSNVVTEDQWLSVENHQVSNRLMLVAAFLNVISEEQVIKTLVYIAEWAQLWLSLAWLTNSTKLNWRTILGRLLELQRRAKCVETDFGMPRVR